VNLICKGQANIGWTTVASHFLLMPGNIISLHGVSSHKIIYVFASLQISKLFYLLFSAGLLTLKLISFASG
jgi:hypothetical protein